MPPFPIQELRQKDTVLVEMSIGRYRTSPKSAEKEGTTDEHILVDRWAWNTWQAYLELRSVALIHRNLGSTVDGDGEEEEFRI